MDRQDELGYIILNATFASQFLIECMDKLSGTDAYRHQMKQAGSKFLAELIRYADKNINMIWQGDKSPMFQIMDYFKENVEKLVSLKPEDNGVISAFVDKYKENPKAICCMLGIKMVEDIPEEKKVK